MCKGEKEADRSAGSRTVGLPVNDRTGNRVQTSGRLLLKKAREARISASSPPHTHKMRGRSTEGRNRQPRRLSVDVQKNSRRMEVLERMLTDGAEEATLCAEWLLPRTEPLTAG